MFDLVLQDLEGVFKHLSSGPADLIMFPNNYQGDIVKNGKPAREYNIFSILPSESNNFAFGGDSKNITGVVAIKMFVPAGEGQVKLMKVADKLDTVMDNKRLAHGTQLGTSYINIEGLDPTNESLYSGSYFIPFTIYKDI